MRNYKTIIRSCLLYIMAVMLATGHPLTVLATTEPVAPDAVVTEVAPQSSEAPTPAPDASQGESSVGPGPSAEVVQQTPEVSTEAPATEAETVPAVVAPPSEPAIIPEAMSSTSVTPDAAPVAPSTAGPAVSSNVSGNTNTTHKSTTEAVNNITSQAQTGNTSVTTNTTAGNATSGDAAATTTIINSVHSTIQGDTAGVAHFTADIHGNVVGDITLSPILSGVLADPHATPLTTAVQADQATNLTNNISLDALSGNASVLNNTTAGNATSGNADTVANVINLINSIIAANKSFVGTINIYGNLDGDILISPDFIPQLLASNAANVVNAEDVPTTFDATDTQSIINNVTLNAASGNADVSGNTSAGSATTGTAKTNLTILNFAGREVVASNSLLVFVNVLGQWVGIIVDAPVGATAAVLGSGVTSNTASRGVDANSTSSITNNIDLSSVTGDAAVQGNTTAGNATSGDATASANIANISTSFFGISDWFGVLFINVFGTWYGSVGVNTASGEVVPITSGTTPLPDLPVALAEVKEPAPVASPPKFGFVPRYGSMLSTGANMAASGVAELISDAPVVTTASAVLDEPQYVWEEEEIEMPVATTAAAPSRPNLMPTIIAAALAALVGTTLMATSGLRRK